MKTELLGSICNISIGRTPSRDNPSYWGKGHKWLSIADMKQGKFLFITKEEITSKAKEECQMKIAPKGTVVMSFKLSVGKVGVLKDAMYTNEAIAALEIKDENKVFKNYLFHALQSLKFDYSGDRAVKGITLNKAKLFKLEIPLPPLPEQKRIATILDKADALCQKNKQQQTAYDELLQATFLDMFGDPVTNPKGWEKRKLGEKIEKIQIGPFGSQLHKADYCESGIPLINPTNIIANKVFLDNAVRISEEKYISLPQYHLKEGDIVMARRGDLSKVALIDHNNFGLFCGTGSLYIRFKSDIDKVFLLHLLAQKKTTNYFEREAVGVTMPNLNKSIISNTPIFLPPISLQTHFAQIVQNIEAQKTLLKKSMQENEDLFNALVQKAFKGEL